MKEIRKLTKRMVKKSQANKFKLTSRSDANSRHHNHVNHTVDSHIREYHTMKARDPGVKVPSRKIVQQLSSQSVDPSYHQRSEVIDEGLLNRLWKLDQEVEREDGIDETRAIFDSLKHRLS